MTARRIALYYAWSRPAEAGAPLAVIENRFPTLFESRRMLYPRFEEWSDPERYDQGIGGFLDHIMKANFVAFVDDASERTGHPVPEIERVDTDGHSTPLDRRLLESVDTLIVISFDSIRTGQEADAAEIAAVRAFLAKPDNLLFVCPHHDIGHLDPAADAADDGRRFQARSFRHHGDRTIPPQQRFGGFARSLLAGLGVPVENRFGLHPAADADGLPMPLSIDAGLDRLGLLTDVTTFNLHSHLPQLERLGDAAEKMDVLARQHIDLGVPPHPFTSGGRDCFDALLQSRPGVFAGTLLVGDATLWSSTAGGVECLRRLWANVVRRASRA